MDGGCNDISHIMTYPKVDGQPIVLFAVLSIHSIGGGIIYHDKEFLASLNMWWGEILFAPSNGEVHNLI
jgi:hypothetical protein